MTELLIGTYTRDTPSRGIYRCHWNPTSAQFTTPELVIAADNPSFLISAGDRIYTVNEVSDYEDKKQGAVTEYSWTGSDLHEVCRLPTLGADPCHLACESGILAVANYNGANVTLYKTGDGIQGGLELLHSLDFDKHGPHPRQSASHPHGTYFNDGELWVPDLGGDCIHRIRPRTGQVVCEVKLPAGSGPRHLLIRGSRIYVIHELDNRVTLLDDNRGTSQSASTLPPDHPGTSITAEIAVTASGRILLASNRGHDCLVSYQIESSGELSNPVFHECGGRHPRHFLLSRDGEWLFVANRDSGNIAAMRIDADDRPGSPVTRVECPAPVCLLEV